MIRRAMLLVLGATCAALAGAADRTPLPMSARWTVPNQLQADLTSEPGDCLTAPTDPAQTRSIAIGAAAFRAPLLLGGQAARSGLSCNSCHRAGHDNPAFSYPGLSGAPGTADVTASLFSSHRGDGQFNPKPIPNLAGDKALLKIDQSQDRGELELFILGLITQEFDGPTPSPAVLTGLASYVRALSPQACRPARADRSGQHFGADRCGAGFGPAQRTKRRWRNGSIANFFCALTAAADRRTLSRQPQSQRRTAATSGRSSGRNRTPDDQRSGGRTSRSRTMAQGRAEVETALASQRSQVTLQPSGAVRVALAALIARLGSALSIASCNLSAADRHSPQVNRSIKRRFEDARTAATLHRRQVGR